MPTAILVDGGFYRKKMNVMKDTPEQAAKDFYTYCLRHLTEKSKSRTVQHELYRILFYDCPPVNTNAFHPLLNKPMNLGNTKEFSWMSEFIEILQKKKESRVAYGTAL